MPVRTLDETPAGAQRRPFPGLWVAALAEIAIAFIVATIILRASPAPSHAGMPGMHHHCVQIHGHATTIAVAALTATMLGWWLVRRTRVPAAAAALGLVLVGASGEVRAMAVQSHLAAMAALEALLVAAPLLAIAALRPRPPGPTASRSPLWTAAVAAAVAVNSALLIALHLPAVHDRAMDLAGVPRWLVPVIVLTGLGYWAAILLTTGRVGPPIRRAALVIGQEVAAILGLAALIRPFAHPHHANALGLWPSVDQRLGGILMLLTCAAVTLPLAKRLDPQRRTELNVH